MAEQQNLSTELAGQPFNQLGHPSGAVLDLALALRLQAS